MTWQDWWGRAVSGRREEAGCGDDVGPLLAGVGLSGREGAMGRGWLARPVGPFPIYIYILNLNFFLFSEIFCIF